MLRESVCLTVAPGMLSGGSDECHSGTRRSSAAPDILISRDVPLICSPA